MVKDITTIKVYTIDRDFLDSIKRKLKIKSHALAMQKIRKLFKENKLHLDLK